MTTSHPLAVSTDIAPMEARSSIELPEGKGWQFEPKWDGFRCLVFKDKRDVILKSKSGKPLERYFPDIANAVAALRAERLIWDGELVIAVDGQLSFEALQMRLHPAASRVAKLAAEAPAQLILFDCLADPTGLSLLDKPLSDRRSLLEQAYRKEASDSLLLSPYTMDRAKAEEWLAGAGGALDGVIAKRRDGPYLPGERAMLKVKPLNTADCVVGGFRYGSASGQVGSLLLGLYDEEGRLDHVGFTSASPTAERPALTRRLEALVEAPGFSGRAPGGPSRWSSERSADWQPLRPELVAEVAYDHVSGGRFRHGTRFVRWRPDKSPRQCRMDQIAPPADPRSFVLSR